MFTFISQGTVYQDPAHLYTTLQINVYTSIIWLSYTESALYKSGQFRCMRYYFGLTPDDGPLRTETSTNIQRDIII